MNGARRRGSTVTQEQLHQFVRFCNAPLPGYPPEQRRLALRLVTDHRQRRTPPRWRPDILYAHGLPRHARALAEILSP